MTVFANNLDYFQGMFLIWYFSKAVMIIRITVDNIVGRPSPIPGWSIFHRFSDNCRAFVWMSQDWQNLWERRKEQIDLNASPKSFPSINYEGEKNDRTLSVDCTGFICVQFKPKLVEKKNEIVYQANRLERSTNSKRKQAALSANRSTCKNTLRDGLGRHWIVINIIGLTIEMNNIVPEAREMSFISTVWDEV